MMGNRTHTSEIGSEQMEWLRQNLATVADKSAPLVIAMHASLFAPPNLNNISDIWLEDGQTFINLLSEFGFSNVHVLSGHTHYNFRACPPAYPWLMEHNIGTISAAWWISGVQGVPGVAGYAGNHLCRCGTPGGYGVYEMDGKDMKWYYKGVGHDRQYQFRAYDRNTINITAGRYAPNANVTFAALAPDLAGEFGTENNGNQVIINVWGYDPEWTVAVTEGSVSLPVTRATTRDPLFIISNDFIDLNRNSDPGAGAARNRSSFFRVTASSPTSTLNIRVTDRFGNVYTETMTRPKDLTYDMK